ncbi:MAG: tRNA uridine-5-carboxymethylaminomethyl(34) synthesis GTPase MnmE [Clostridia bacterium]|nr:tRNA uridine-5-carboxymethylaminomethyl(34) synthesis GTPase MnmE [Clostridia bacterium]
MLNRTIAAVSTPYGRGGIAVIRISGENAVSVAGRMFSTRGGKLLSEFPSRYSVYGDIVDNGTVIDDGMAVIFRAPASYTGEDTVEISCHGGILLTEKVLSLCYACGASPAEAGEFTQRAFINGKIDLSKAEAVIGLIDAESDHQLKLNASHAQGVMKRCIDGYISRVTRLISSVYVCIDYPDEDLEEVGAEEMKASLALLSADMGKTLATYREGRAVNEGINTVILGKPNAGKSSLLNRLLGVERAIVTDIAGTTRDTIEEKALVGRVMLNICDTAGIRETEDVIERIGVDRALEKADGADLIIAVFDGSRPLDEEDERLMEFVKKQWKLGKSVLVALNKSDLPRVIHCRELQTAIFGGACGESEGLERTAVCRISAGGGSEEDGIDSLKSAIEELFVSGEIDYNSVAVVSNARQYNAMKTAFDAVNRAKNALEEGFSPDVCGLDLETALACLGEIDGRGVTETVTEDIFHRFCVGK